MKRTGNLIHKISELNNLQFAFYKAKKGKWHKTEVIEYSKNLTENLKNLQNQILTGNIHTGNYHFFTIYDPKERQICAASFPERVLHHAIMNICHPFFEKKLIADTYATRIGKGTYKAIEKAKLNTQKNTYFIKFDIRKYFDSINHDILKKILAKIFKDKKLLLIFDRIIDSYNSTTQAFAQSEGLGKGLPIGNLTSQYFANIYLGQLDNFVKHNFKIKYYVRYMYDFILWTNNRQEIADTGQKVKDFLHLQLALDLKTFFSNKSSQGLSFLSYKLFPDKILLTRKAKKRFSNNIKKYTKLLKDEQMTQEEYARRARALISFTEHASAKGFRRKVFDLQASASP